MPRPALRSRSLRRARVRTPGGALVTHYEQRKPSPARCGGCGSLLSGIPRERPARLGKLPLTSRRPSRPFGGNLCSPCTRQAVKERARALWEGSP